MPTFLRDLAGGVGQCIDKLSITDFLLTQLLLGLINGAFYAMLSLGLAVIFGMLNVVNFAHGALYMTGAFLAWILAMKLGPGLVWVLTQLGIGAPAGLAEFGIGYWGALVVVPLIVAVLGIAIERGMLRWLYKLDHIYGLLLTFGVALIIQGLFNYEYGSSGLQYESTPAIISGGEDLGFMYLPRYRAFVVGASLVICLGTWYVIERTKLGSYLRAATENAPMVQAFGINVPRMITLTYAAGVGLAALAGVLAAPITNITPLIGGDIIIVVFAVVVIGGMGSIMGSIVTGFALGMIEGLTKVCYSEASNTVVFVIMAIVLLLKPAGLFGRGV
jgi:branched-chain amino acid transport system permease protein